MQAEVAIDVERIRAAVESLEDLRLLVLHGSRSRGDASPRSDWDFAYLAGPGLDELDLRARLCRSLDTDRVDVADLYRAGGLLAFRVARDGRLVLERRRGEFDEFRHRAATFWYDIAPIVRAENEAILKDLG